MSALTADRVELAPAVEPTGDADGLLRRLKSGYDGLSSREAQRRLIQFGPNELSRSSPCRHG
ncbi:MAG: cation-transporting P-type ATPase [Solirubrobacteraceae bacterium]